MRALSAAALKSIFSPDADSNLITLITISGGDLVGSIRLSNNYLQRLSETADDVVYGVVSRGNQFIFLPLEISLPTDEHESSPRCQISIHDVTQYLTPTIRTTTQALDVTLELVLSTTPDVVEASFTDLLMSSITYNKDTVTAELSVESDEMEPFPADTFTPSNFPGLF